MRPSQEAALAAIADRFTGVPFVVGGSALLALHGADVEVGDLDLMVAAAAADAIESAAGDWWRGRRDAVGHPHIDSAWLVDLEVEGEAVDVMGGLALVSNGVRWEMPLRGGGVADVGGSTIPLAAVGPWVVLYTLYRPQRASELVPFDSEELARTTAELPPGMGIEWPQATLLPDPEETP